MEISEIENLKRVSFKQQSMILLVNYTGWSHRQQSKYLFQEIRIRKV